MACNNGSTFNAQPTELQKKEKYVISNINKNLPPLPHTLNAQKQWRTLLSSLCLSDQFLLTERAGGTNAAHGFLRREKHSWNIINALARNYSPSLSQTINM